MDFLHFPVKFYGGNAGISLSGKLGSDFFDVYHLLLYETQEINAGYGIMISAADSCKDKMRSSEASNRSL